MSSEGNQMNDGTSFQPSEPTLCANGCGFFGSAATMDLCSKCYRDFTMKEEQKEKAKKAFQKIVNKNQEVDVNVHAAAAVESSSGLAVVKPSSFSTAAEPPVESGDGVVSGVNNASSFSKQKPNRCLCCNKKVGVMGFTCRCGSTFCGVHRYPEKHDCSFDFKSQGRDAIAKANPVVKADKVDRI